MLLGQTPLRLVVAVRRNAPGRKVALRVVRGTPGERILKFEVARLLAVEERLLLFADHAHVDADLREVRLDRFGDGLLLRVLGVEVETKRKRFALLFTNTALALHPTGGVQDRLRLLRVVPADGQRDVAVRDVLREERLGRRFRPVEDPLDDRVAVDRVLNRLTHAQIRRDGAPGIHENRAARDRHGERRAELPRLGQRREGVARQLVAVGAEDEVDLTLFERHQHRLRIGDHVPAHGGDRGLFARVGVVARKDRVLVELVLTEHPGTGAGEARHARLRAALLHAGGRNEAEGTREPELDQGREVGVLHAKAPRVFVDDVVPFDFVHHVEPGVVRAVGEHGVDVRLHRGGVERRPVGELHVFAEVKDVRAAVVRNLPTLCELGLHALGRVLHQRFEDHRLRGHLTQIEVRIDVADVLHRGVLERAGGSRRSGGGFGACGSLLLGDGRCEFVRASREHGTRECEGGGEREG